MRNNGRGVLAAATLPAVSRAALAAYVKAATIGPPAALEAPASVAPPNTRPTAGEISTENANP